MAHRTALSHVILACDDCFADVFNARNDMRKNLSATPRQPNEQEALAAMLVPTDDEQKCAVHNDTKPSVKTSQKTATSEVTTELGTICRPCYLQVGKAAKSKNITAMAGMTECAYMLCQDNCAGDPNICDCAGTARVRMHTEILAHINRIEIAAETLEVTHNTISHFRTYEGKKLKIDKAVPESKAKRFIEQTGGYINELIVDGRQIFTKPGRNFTIDGRDEEFTCHHHRIAFYAPANYTCTGVGCSCDDCILRHVKHSAEDYEDAIERLKLGIVKPRAVPKGQVIGSRVE